MRRDDSPYIFSIVAVATALIVVVALTSATAHGQDRLPQRLAVYDRAGNLVSTPGEPADYTPAVPVFSPDGTRLAIVNRRARPGRIELFDLSTGVSTQIAFPLGLKWQAAWSPDGGQIVFVSRRDAYDGLYRIASNGTGSEELLYRHRLGVNIQGTIDWSSDGRFLCFESGDVLFVLALNGDGPSTASTGLASTSPGRSEVAEGRKAVELVREEYRVGGGRFSPDSHFLAYTSDESGRDEVYVRTFDTSSGRFSSDGGKWQVSNQGGSRVSWSRNGSELYYITEDGGVMAVELTTSPTFKAGRPQLLFRTSIYGTSRDGQRFVGFLTVPSAERSVPTRARIVVTIPLAILVKYVGTYAWSPFDEDEDAVVTLEGSQLMIQTNYQEQARQLSAESKTTFFSGNTNFEFVKDEKGVVMHIISGTTRWTRK